MYQVIHKYPNTPVKTLLMVLGIVLVLVLSNTFFSAVARETGQGFWMLFPYLIAAAILYLLYVNVLDEYGYILTGSTLHVERATGKRAKPLVAVPLKDAVSFEKTDRRIHADYRCALPSAKEKWLLVYSAQDGRTRSLLFVPDERMIELIREQIASFNPTNQTNNTEEEHHGQEN